jgi:hypothetical protein
MTDKTTIEMNVDTFGDGAGYFVRTEIETRSVSISGPFPDLQSAQALKAHRLASREKVSAALEEQLRRAVSTLPAAGPVAS